MKSVSYPQFNTILSLWRRYFGCRATVSTNYPELWRGVFDLAEFVKQNFIERFVSHEASRIAIDKNVSIIRDEFGYESAPILERLLIDNILIAWLQKQ
ncbi:MAG: hypothetical protein WCA79_16010 [Anaerolineales bacterium]